MGSHASPAPQHEPPPLVTRSATCPYFCFTISLLSSPLIAVSLFPQGPLICRRKGSVAAPGQHAQPRRRPDRLHEALDRLQRLRVQRVVDPPALPAVGHHPGVLERLEMERQARLARLEIVGE